MNPTSADRGREAIQSTGGLTFPVLSSWLCILGKCVLSRDLTRLETEASLRSAPCKAWPCRRPRPSSCWRRAWAGRAATSPGWSVRPSSHSPFPRSRAGSRTEASLVLEAPPSVLRAWTPRTPVRRAVAWLPADRGLAPRACVVLGSPRLPRPTPRQQNPKWKKRDTSTHRARTRLGPAQGRRGRSARWASGWERPCARPAQLTLRASAGRTRRLGTSGNILGGTARVCPRSRVVDAAANAGAAPRAHREGEGRPHLLAAARSPLEAALTGRPDRHGAAEATAKACGRCGLPLSDARPTPEAAGRGGAGRGAAGPWEVRGWCPARRSHTRLGQA